MVVRACRLLVTVGKPAQYNFAKPRPWLILAPHFRKRGLRKGLCSRRNTPHKTRIEECDEHAWLLFDHQHRYRESGEDLPVPACQRISHEVDLCVRRFGNVRSLRTLRMSGAR